MAGALAACATAGFAVTGCTAAGLAATATGEATAGLAVAAAGLGLITSGSVFPVPAIELDKVAPDVCAGTCLALARELGPGRPFMQGNPRATGANLRFRGFPCPSERIRHAGQQIASSD